MSEPNLNEALSNIATAATEAASILGRRFRNALQALTSDATVDTTSEREKGWNDGYAWAKIEREMAEAEAVQFAEAPEEGQEEVSVHSDAPEHISPQAAVRQINPDLDAILKNIEAQARTQPPEGPLGRFLAGERVPVDDMLRVLPTAGFGPIRQPRRD